MRSFFLLGLHYFYPRSPCGERLDDGIHHPCAVGFLSTLSLRRATHPAASHCYPPAYFYPRSPCGERQPAADIRHCGSTISIHALLAESDDGLRWNRPPVGHFYPRSPCGERLYYLENGGRQICISIHALLAESDRSMKRRRRSPTIFLSTLSLRRATAKVHKTVEHFCAYETNFMEIASSC